MSVTDAAVQEAGPRQRTERIVNDFAIQVATVNGSGSQTANLVLLRSIFQMGVPVSGKNMFPSNIAGLPTWYTIRASAKGYIGRKKEVDLLVAMNPETAKEDVLTLAPGAAVVYDEPLKLNELRSDLIFYPVPFDKLMQPITHDAKLRRLVRNMMYDGVLSRLLSIDMGQMEKALRKQMGKKVKAIELNMSALKAGYDYAEANLPKQDPFVVEPMDKTDGMILIEGNAAAAIGCMMAGVTFVGWYPITPSSSLCESLIDYLKKYRKDPETGKATYAVIQAEDELAALGMVIGAGWVGARAMTSTAGPGISLMAEFTGLGYYAEVPAVIFDVQRCGPSTGLPTRTGQQDILSTAVLSHGDTKHPLLLPVLGHRVLHDGDGRVRPRRAAADAGLRHVGPRPGHEHLDVAAVRLPDQAARPRQAARRRRRSSASASSRATATWTATASRIARCPATACRRTSRAARATTRRRSTASAPTTTRRTSIGSRGSSRRRGRWCRSPRSRCWPTGKVGIIAYGTTHWAIVESRDQLKNEAQLTTSYLRLQGVSVHARGLRVHRRRATASTSSSRTATARCCRCSRWSAIRRSSPSCARVRTTRVCRSTAGP